MPSVEIAQYGIATFALAGVFYFVFLYMRQRNGAGLTDHLLEVIQNNTRALEELTICIKVSMTRQEAKIDELLERARR